MEIGERQRPSPVHVVEPPKEERTAPEVWRDDDFHWHLTAPQEFAYDRLPHEIQLSPSWHGWMDKLLRNTLHDGREWSFEVACLDREGPLLSNPYGIEPFFRDHWGSADNPVFLSHLAQGSEYSASAFGIPAAIEWHGETLPMKRVVFVHTHPNDTPFSSADLRWLTQRNREEKCIAAVTQSNAYFLLRTDATPDHADRYIEEQAETQSWRERLNFQLRFRQTLWKQNVRFAQDHKLGLYRGRPEEALVRIA